MLMFCDKELTWKSFYSSKESSSHRVRKFNNRSENFISRTILSYVNKFSVFFIEMNNVNRLHLTYTHKDMDRFFSKKTSITSISKHTIIMKIYDNIKQVQLKAIHSHLFFEQTIFSRIYIYDL